MCKIKWIVPDPSLELLNISSYKDHLQLIVKSTATSACCPKCDQLSSRVHSKYSRVIQDLPIANQPVSFIFLTKKWFCTNFNCPSKVFAERYDWLAPNARRTLRAEETLRKVAFSTSCLTGEKVAKAIYLPVSHDVLLTIIHRTNVDRKVSSFVGIDDFAFRKAHTYGTLVCDLTNHKPVAVLPNREPNTITSWLKQHTHIKVVSRDGYNGFRQGILAANKMILQVYDRFSRNFGETSYMIL